MKFSLSYKIILLLFILIINGYTFFGEPFYKGEMINKESREFNKLLSDEIEKMDGVILSRRGKLNGFFSLDVTFENSRLYDKNKFLEYIKSIGFVLDEGISSTSKVKLFCKGEIGVSISGSIRLRIYYDYRMSECKNKN